MKYVMHYETVPDAAEGLRAHFVEHRARLDEFHARGSLLMAGPFLDETGGALGIFATREAAEEFIRDDPFVVNGLVSSWTVREWHEVLADAK